MALFGLMAKLGMAVTPGLSWSPSQAMRYVEVQRDVSDVTGHPLARDVMEGDAFPYPATMGQLFSKGACPCCMSATGTVHCPLMTIRSACM